MEVLLAHGVGSVYESPIPLWLYLAGAAATVFASLFVAARARALRPLAEHQVGGTALARTITTAAKVAGVVVVVGILVFAVTSPRPGFTAAPLLFWTGLVIGTALVSAVVGDVWPRANPWRLLAGDEDEEDEADEEAGTRPAWWAGPLGLYALFWFELVSGEGFNPLAIVMVLLAYSAWVLTLRPTMGRSLDLADPFAILFDFASRSAPLRLTPDALVRRSPLAGLDEDRPMPAALFAGVFVVLGSTTLDNVRETVEWSSLLRALGVESAAPMLVDSVALALMTLPFFAPFVVAAAAASASGGPGDVTSGRLDLARRLGWSLIPIAVAYLLAHNMPLFMTGVPEIIREVARPFGLEPFHGYSPSPQIVWFLEVALVVGGHVLGVLAAQRALLRAGDGARGVARHLPLTLLMSGYTILTLWLLSLPLVEG